MRTALASSHHSRLAEQLRRAWDALQRPNYASARKFASLVKNDSELGDYGRWILAMADLEQARRAYDDNRLAQASRFAHDVIMGLRGLDVSFPYSPLVHRLPQDIGLAELIEARVLYDQKKLAFSMKQYEDAFDRIVGTPELVSILPEDLEFFSEECSTARTELCRSWLEKLGQVYPRSTIEFKALSRPFPRFHEEFPKPTYVGKVTQAYRAPDLDLPAFDSALELYMDRKYGDSINALLKFLDEYPRSALRFRARYWLAQALIQQKKQDEGTKLLQDVQDAAPLTFYGLLAAQATGKDLEDSLTDDLPVATDSDPYLLPQEVFRLRRAEKLLAAKAYDLAAIELRDFRARDVLSNEFLTYLVLLQIEARNYGRAFGVLNELIARGARNIYSTYVVRLIFPVPDWQLVKKYSEQNGIDPILALSLMKQESSFDSKAVSPVGALGLMQLMPSTAADLSPDQPRAELVQLESNIRTGTRYLGKLLNRFNGNIALALAAYNSGPGAVDRWVRANPGRGMLEFLELIPYKETREYVQAIIRNYFWYARKLNPEGAKTLNLDYFWTDSRSKTHLSPNAQALDQMSQGDDEELLFGPPMPKLTKAQPAPVTTKPAAGLISSPMIQRGAAQAPASSDGPAATAPMSARAARPASSSATTPIAPITPTSPPSPEPSPNPVEARTSQQATPNGVVPGANARGLPDTAPISDPGAARSTSQDAKP